MNTIILVCIVLVTVFFCSGIVYLILTLVEMRKLAEDARHSVDEINHRIEEFNLTLDHISHFVDTTLSVTSVFSKGVFTTANVLLGLGKFVGSVVNARKKSHKREEENDGK